MSTDRYDWTAMRADIESGRVQSFADLSAKYGATEQAIRNRRKADEKAGNPWPTPTIRRPKNNVVPIGAAPSHNKRKTLGGGQSAQSDGDEPLDLDEGAPLADELSKADFLALQPGIAILMARASQGMLRKLIRGNITPGMHQSHADVFNAVMSGVKTALAMGREIAGRGKGEASSDSGEIDTDSTLIIETVRLDSARHKLLEERKAAS